MIISKKLFQKISVKFMNLIANILFPLTFITGRPGRAALADKYDIVFIGRLDTGTNEHRLKILNFLLTKGVNI